MYRCISVACAAIAFLSTGCTQSGGLPLQPQAASTGPAADQYRLGAGDLLHVQVYLEPDLTSDYPVLPDGTVMIAPVGAIPVGGLTPADAQQVIVARLTKVVKNPGVGLSIAAYRPYFVLGEVTKPGKFAYDPGTTLAAAIANAGGYTFRANSRQLILRRAGETEERRIALVPGSSLVIGPGDVITVPKRFF